MEEISMYKNVREGMIVIMEKIDFKKKLKHLFTASSKECKIVDVPKMKYIMFDGQGNPNTSPLFQGGVEALYGIAYKIKFNSKKTGLDYVVPPLSGLWYMDDMRQFCMEGKEQWKWTLLIMQPEHITSEMEEAKKVVEMKKKTDFSTQVRLESYHEGLAAQIMHIGPYEGEPPTIAKLHKFIEEKGYSLRGKHHEIYLGDPRKTAPEKLKTIIRQPID